MRFPQTPHPVVLPRWLAPALVAMLVTACATPVKPENAMAPGSHALAAVAACPADPGWTDPSPPRHIHGDTWYVGTCGLSALLVTSPQGHVLIDGTTEAGAELVEANIKAAGFALADVRYILNSHAHFDHAGGIARLAADSGATVMAGAPALPTLRRGSSDRQDPQLLSLQPFPPIAAPRPLVDGQVIRLGRIAITAHATPGHTPGGMSFSWPSCENGHCVGMVFADSLTPISDDVYRYTDEPAHPGALAAFSGSIERVATLPCDILVSTHPAASQLWRRLGPGSDAPLVDPGACRRYAGTARRALAERIQAEQEAGQR